MTSECQDLHDQIVGLVEGDLERAATEYLRAHAAACPECAREIELEQTLVDALRALPPAPAFSVPCPDPEQKPVIALSTARARAPGASGGPVPGARSRLIALATTIAVAAILLVVVGARITSDLRVHPADDGDLRDLADSSRAVVIRTVIDSDADVALPDDDLLALTAGVEAVVMRRPARRR